MYEYYVNLLYNCSTLFVYNIETNGFGKEKYFGGDILSYFDENTPVEYSALEKVKPERNSHNFYENKINLEVLKIKGSS